MNSPAEAREEATRKRKGRRNAILVIGIINILVLVDGISGASDLRRMSTPQGAAAAWADAAASGDCDTYVDLEGPARLAADLAGITLGPTVTTRKGGLCQKVAMAWAGLSVQKSDVVLRQPEAAVVRLTVSGQHAGPFTGEVFVSHITGKWRVGITSIPPCTSPAYTPLMALCSVITLPKT